MTEVYEDGNYLVRVRAQVMTRDDSTGGWVPMGGGGLSNVSVRKRTLPSDPDDAKYEYLIYGKRISDQSVVLSCIIKKDFEYNRVMPTFHHWRTGNKKFGLTFQTAADARAFDKGVTMAVQDLLDGLADHYPIYGIDIGDDDVFMTLDLPVERGDSQSSSGSSTTGGSSRHTPLTETTQSPYTHPHANHHHLHRMHFLSKCPNSPATPNGNNNGTSNNNANNNGTSYSTGSSNHNGSSNNNGSSNHNGHGDNKTNTDKVLSSSDEALVQGEGKISPDKERKEGGQNENDKIEVVGGEYYSYVQFAVDKPPVHEYSYPVVDASKSDKRDSISSLKKHNLDVITTQPPLPKKMEKKRDRKKDRHKLLRARCRHCQEMFTEEMNLRGSCEYAPDCVKTGINAISCISCAQCMLYHCMSDAEGDFAHHPCDCSPVDEHCGRRWIGLTLLSLLTPCLWCYLPLRTCYNCGVACGVCGGKHEAT